MIKPEDLEVSDFAKLHALYKRLNSWKTICHNENLESVFITILRDSGLLNWIMGRPRRYEILDKFSGVYEEIKILTQKNPNFSLEDFIGYLDLLETHEILLKKPPKTIVKSAVRLMTAHRSKGLEFDYVYIINCYDTHWGNLRRRGKGFHIPWEYLGIKLKVDIEIEENEDERRLFYVAMTRARKNITISYSTRGLDGKEQVPSQFIAEIDEQYILRVDTADFETSFLENKEILFTPRDELTHDPKHLEFVRELFLERGMSPTALNNYLKCPWRYFYENLVQLPDLPDKHLIFGSAVHYAISDFIKALKTKSPDTAFLLDRFQKSLERHAVRGETKEDLLEKGKNALPGFYETVAKNWPKTVMSEMRIKGVRLQDDVTINGVIDMLLPTSNTEAIVYDFKTGDPKTRGEIEGTTKNSNGDYKRQLVFYKLLLDHYQEHKLRATQGIISFVEPDSKARFHEEKFIITEDDTGPLEQLIIAVSKDILSLGFWDRRCDDAECPYCSLRAMMDL
jgi:DNA helicase-2/ATP-dependent DNA helicase PcrA